MTTGSTASCQQGKSCTGSPVPRKGTGPPEGGIAVNCFQSKNCPLWGNWRANNSTSCRRQGIPPATTVVAAARTSLRPTWRTTDGSTLGWEEDWLSRTLNRRLRSTFGNFFRPAFLISSTKSPRDRKFTPRRRRQTLPPDWTSASLFTATPKQPWVGLGGAARAPWALGVERVLQVAGALGLCLE